MWRVFGLGFGANAFEPGAAAKVWRAPIRPASSERNAAGAMCPASSDADVGRSAFEGDCQYAQERSEANRSHP